MRWTARVRTSALLLADPVEYTRLELVDNYNSPSVLVLEGNLDELRPAMVLGSGIVVQDEGVRRFSGNLHSVRRNGDRTAELTYRSDLELLWRRIAWPVPTFEWFDQGTTYDEQTGPAETRILGYINRNLGPLARAERRVSRLRIPASQGRGGTYKSRARFEPVGDFVARIADAYGLRVNVVQTYNSAADPYLDVVITAAPDLSGSVRISGPLDGGDIFLADDWSYSLTAPDATVALAGNFKGTVLYAQKTAAAQESRWLTRIETFADQGDTADANEIDEVLDLALAEGAGSVEVSLPIEVRGDELEIPLGSKVSAIVDGEVVVERIRQVTTQLQNEQGQATQSVTAVLGTPDAGFPNLTTKRLTQALKRIKRLEAR